MRHTLRDSHEYKKEPYHREDEPGEVEGGAEPQQSPRPGQVYHRGKEVFQVSVKLFGYDHNSEIRDSHDYIQREV